MSLTGLSLNMRPKYPYHFHKNNSSGTWEGIPIRENLKPRIVNLYGIFHLKQIDTTILF